MARGNQVGGMLLLLPVFSPLKQTRGWSPAYVKTQHSPKLLPQREIILSSVNSLVYFAAQETDLLIKLQR